jgi:hypothetical protein
MANDPEDPRTATVEAEEPDHEGGPVKTFLEHLEDLRWVLIKSLVGLGIGMFICLIGGDQRGQDSHPSPRPGDCPP